MSFVALYPWLKTTKSEGGLPWPLRKMLDKGLYFGRPLGQSSEAAVEAVGVEWGTEDDRGFRGFEIANNMERRLARKLQRQDVLKCGCQVTFYAHKHLYNYFLKSRYTKKDARAVLEWIKTVTNDTINTSGDEENFAVTLKDGSRLCKLANVLKAGAVKNVYTSTKAVKCMDNVNNFLAAVTILGVPSKDLFEPNDLLEMHNLNAVLNCLESLKRRVSQYKNDFGYNGNM